MDSHFKRHCFPAGTLLKKPGWSQSFFACLKTMLTLTADVSG